MKIKTVIGPILVATAMGWIPASPADETGAPGDSSQTVQLNADSDAPMAPETTPWVALKTSLRKIMTPPPAVEERALAPTNPNVPVLPTNRPTPPTGFPQ
jgi:hypothetical protein